MVVLIGRPSSDLIFESWNGLTQSFDDDSVSGDERPAPGTRSWLNPLVLSVKHWTNFLYRLLDTCTRIDSVRTGSN